MVSSIPRDTPLTDFETIKMLKQSPCTTVYAARHAPSNRKVVIKAYSKEQVQESGMIDRVLAERDILRLVSNISAESLFSKSAAPSKQFPRCLNRLVTTTKDEDHICLILEMAEGIDLVQVLKLLQPRLKWEPDSNVFEHTVELELFLKDIAV